MLGLGVAGFLVQAFVKMYYMVHAFFAEYKFVDVAGLNGTKNKKTNMADRKSTRLNSSHYQQSRMPSSA